MIQLASCFEKWSEKIFETGFVPTIVSGEELCLRLFFLHKQSLCYSMNSLFSNISRKYYCGVNIVATKCVHFEKVQFINNQLLSTANAKDINTDSYITNSTLASKYHGPVA